MQCPIKGKNESCVRGVRTYYAGFFPGLITWKRGLWRSIFCNFFKKTPKSPWNGLRKRAKNSLKTGLFYLILLKKSAFVKFFLIDFQIDNKKIKKKYVTGVECNLQSTIFAVPNEGERTEVLWGEGRREMFIERMKKDVANTQGFFWGSQAMRPGQTKKKKKEII